MLIDEQDSDIFALSELAECGFDTMNLGFRFNDGEVLLALRNLTDTG